MKKHGDNRDNFHATISTPFVSSKVLEEETPSPAEVAKSYMGSRPTKLAPSPLGLTSHNTTSLQKTSITPKTANNFKGLKNGFLTPRSRGRSAMYSMARTPYTKSPLNFNQKEIMSTSSQSLKRRSSVLDDDFGSGGPLRRTRQKPNLLLQSREKRELGYTTFQQPMLLENKPEENGDAAIHGSTHGSVPAKSTQTATKIFQQLERLTPKSPTKLTSNMLHGQALRSLEKADSPKFLQTSHDTQKSEFQHESTSKSTSRGKEKVEENGERKFPVPFNMLTPVNGDLGVSIKESSQIVTVDDSTSILPSEPPQKRRAFQMSAPEDTWELDDDDDDDIHVNGHVYTPPVVENNKPETSLVVNKPGSADIIEPPTPPVVFKTPAPVEATPVVAEVTPVAKSSEKVELKESEKATPFPKTDGFLGGNVIEQETGFKFPTSPPSTFTTQKDEVTPTEKVSPFQFSGSELSESKPKAPDSTSVFNLDTKNDQVKVTNKDENGNDQKLENIPAASSTSAIFSFASSAAKDSSGPTPTMTPDSSSPIFSSSTSFPASDANANSVFNNSSSNIIPASTSIATSSVFSTTSLPPPAFSFGSSKPTTSLAETGKADAITEKEPKSTISSSPFATITTPNGGGLFGFSSPTATSTTTAATTTTNGGALFGFSSPAASSTTTAATSGGALFGFSSPAATSTTTSGSALFGFGSSAATSTTATTSTTNGGALFGFSSPAATSTTTTATSGGALFGFSAPAATSTTTTTNGSTPFGFSSPAATSTTTTTSGSTPFGFSSPAATSTTATTTNGGAFFGFSSPAATSTTTAQSQGSFFNAASGSQSNTQTSTPVTQAVPFQFSSSSSLFGSSAPAFGISSSEGKSGNSTSGSTSTTSIFGSSWQPPNSSVFSFGASSAATTPPITFGASSNTTASTGSSMFSFTTSGPTKPSFTTPSTVFGNPTPVFANNNNNNNNDQMSMEDSMAEDSMQTPSPSPVSVSPFGQAAPVAASPGFMFGSATPAPPQAAAPFQFGGQPNQVLPQNPFQSSSVEFNAGGGSFSLGSGGGDKSGRRMVRVTKSKNRRK
ncbi:nuclear pore complex protein NUP1 isoform X3 [Lactuca sativa]|nr:nuclear pore complex protein NUP1 isoform X3 [Lactuca sativa]XP_052623085.1 nuclear pore complex protein NUP1 isoform X3 [Lactuca sativa]XP_052623086.1 nuclear pore complex protein NUP1 isoform X3 [Lactuca sativa]XP_052623087.1 nuclear pore complex protein NUP1 isoform X3 [Lactuca sativa]XP_052623088.1 nuclear pore complex protein NUP1 isoform X3 [Lactuca sativa]XP_052623089.1 nuclear pore complex protein NUP1 isoform X3 [Lactuca sativa]